MSAEEEKNNTNDEPDNDNEEDVEHIVDEDAVSDDEEVDVNVEGEDDEVDVDEGEGVDVAEGEGVDVEGVLTTFDEIDKENQFGSTSSIDTEGTNSSSDDESYAEQEEYSQVDVKIDDEFKMDYIKKLHPEEVNDNYSQMNAYTVIERDDDMNIKDSNHTTYPFLTKYEKTRILGLRITQLNEGSKPFFTPEHHIIDNHLIAERELKLKLLPFIIMRPLPNGKKEYWRLQDLELLDR